MGVGGGGGGVGRGGRFILCRGRLVMEGWYCASKLLSGGIWNLRVGYGGGMRERGEEVVEVEDLSMAWWEGWGKVSNGDTSEQVGSSGCWGESPSITLREFEVRVLCKNQNNQ